MQFRTDLAIEVADEAQHLTDEDVGKDTFREGDTCVTRLHIRTDRAARALGKMCIRDRHRLPLSITEFSAKS